MALLCNDYNDLSGLFVNEQIVLSLIAYNVI